MSQLEVAKNTSPVYAFTFAAMAAGTITSTNVQATFNASSLVNYFNGTSKVIGIVRTTSGGVPGIPRLADLGVLINSTADGYIPQLQLRANNITDTSVYTIYWVNEVVSSSMVSVIPC